MGSKVDLHEVKELAQKIKQDCDSLTENFTAIKNSKNEISEMEGFLGTSAMNVKDYIDEFHLPINDAFQNLLIVISENFDKHISKFQSMVDNSDSAIIQNDYLYVDVGVKMKTENNNFKSYMSVVEDRVNDIADIVPISSPNTYDVTKAYLKLSEDIEDLRKDFENFQSKGKVGLNKADEIINTIEAVFFKAKQVDSSERIVDYDIGTANKSIYRSKEVVSAINKLKGLGGNARDVATEAQNYGYKGKPKKANLKPHPYTIDGKKEKFKYVGREVWDEKKNKVIKAKNTTVKTAKTIKDTVKDPKTAGKQVKNKTKSMVDTVKDPDKLGKQVKKLPKSFGKALGPVGTGLNGYTNYHDARAEGLTKKQATLRSISDTTVDTAVGGAVMTASIAAGTAFIPIPGLGTAVGVAAGMFINGALDKGFGKTNQSVMDYVKKPFRKVASWFG